MSNSCFDLSDMALIELLHAVSKCCTYFSHACAVEEEAVPKVKAWVSSCDDTVSTSSVSAQVGNCGKDLWDSTLYIWRSSALVVGADEV